jgi:SAM-dependent methyltransferase
MDQRYEIFGASAARYDLHTPPDQYKGDHELVLDELRRFAPGARVLDLGCGTGALLRRVRDAGYDAHGIDVSPEMVALAEQRLGSSGSVRVQRLQDVEEEDAYDALVSLSFPFNYCADVSDMRGALARFHRALRPGGLLLLQVAHAANATGRLMEFWERGPGGDRDVQFLCRFTSEWENGEPAVRAHYVYACRSLHELFSEEHLLHVADANRIGELLRESGFSDVRIYGNCEREPIANSICPFVIARRTAVDL